MFPVNESSGVTLGSTRQESLNNKTTKLLIKELHSGTQPHECNTWKFFLLPGNRFEK